MLAVVMVRWATVKERDDSKRGRRRSTNSKACTLLDLSEACAGEGEDTHTHTHTPTRTPTSAHRGATGTSCTLGVSVLLVECFTLFSINIRRRTRTAVVVCTGASCRCVRLSLSPRVRCPLNHDVAPLGCMRTGEETPPPARPTHARLHRPSLDKPLSPPTTTTTTTTTPLHLRRHCQACAGR